MLDGVAGVRRLRSRGRQPGLALAVGPQHEDEPPRRDDRREQRGVGRVLDASNVPSPTSSGRRARRVTTPSVDELVVHRALQPGQSVRGGVRAGVSFDVSAAAVNLFAMHNRMHDFTYWLGSTEANWSNAGEQLRPDRGVRRERPPGRRRAGGGAHPGRARQREHVHAARRSVVGHEHVPLAAVRRLVLRRASTVSDMGVIGQVRPHGREPHDRQGTNRTGHHAGAMGESNSDLMSIEHLASSGFTPTGQGTSGRPARTRPATRVRGIRNYAGNFPQTGAFPTPGVSPLIDPLNFSDIGYDLTGPGARGRRDLDRDELLHQAGAGGEVRRVVPVERRTLRPVRQRRPAAGELLATGAGSSSCSTRSCWARTVVVAARDAMLAADVMRFGGENQKALGRVRLARPRPVRVEHERHRPCGRRRVGPEPAARLRVPDDFECDGPFQASLARAGDPGRQRADLRRTLRGPRLADRRHEPRHERRRAPGEQPRTRSPVRSRDVRVRRDRTGFGRPFRQTFTDRPATLTIRFATTGRRRPAVRPRPAT